MVEESLAGLLDTGAVLVAYLDVYGLCSVSRGKFGEEVRSAYGCIVIIKALQLFIVRSEFAGLG